VQKLPSAPAPSLDELVDLHHCAFDRLADEWERFEKKYGRALLAKVDRYYLLVVVLHRMDAMHPWLYARCREVEANPDGYLDLWAREHYKSTIITFAGTIQEIIRNPEITIGIFSHTKPTARKFLVQIKTELEKNEDLKRLYPDIFWADPKKDSPRWSEEKGIIVKRQSNPKEATVEGHGLVDGQPTGSHFSLLEYDDVVTLESVSTPEQVQKTTDAHALSDNLGARGADGRIRKWHTGTRYSFADTYQELLDRKSLKPRIYPATDDGTVSGKPVFLTPEAWAEKVRDQPGKILAAQQLQNPAAGSEASFQKEWLRFADVRPATLNVYILCDPASSRKKRSDRTAIAVIGVDAGMNKWLLDGYCHKMGLSERWTAIKYLRKVWMAMPGVQSVKVGYERYGSTSDLEYFEEQMQRDREAFEIMELAWPREGPGAKDDRIQRLEPDFKNGRFWLAAVSDGETSNQAKMREAGQSFRIFKPVKRRDENGNLYSLNKVFIQEFLTHPFSQRDDFIDAASRIHDIGAVAPVIVDQRSLQPQVFVDGV